MSTSASRKRRRETGGSAPDSTLDPSRGSLRPGHFLLLYLLFAGAALLAYEPSLEGAFLSDDQHYVAQNDYVHDLGFASIVAILDPAGDPAKVVENYAPVHLLLHGIEWKFFGPYVLGYHVVNVLFHALSSLLLVLFFRRFGVSDAAAVIAGAFFLLHPANVEAVAWISQLKTSSALSLTLAALLVYARRPALSTVLFALALFAKPTAAVALFALALMVAFGVGLARDGRTQTATGSRRWRWVVAWGVVFLFFAVVEFAAFGKTAGQAPVLYLDPIERFRSTCAIALRYLVMAVSGHGLSTFHEPEAAGWLDPWWLGSVAALAVLGFRMVGMLLAREAEGIFWFWAVVSFAPISGLIPLPFPMADRYLYFILPGLMGGVLLAGPKLARGFGARVSLQISAQQARAACLLVAVAWVGYFADVTHTRNYVWLNAASMMADAELHYPEGMPAQTRIAHRLAMQGDAEGTVAALRKAYARGYNRLDHLISDPGYDLIRNDEVFQEFVREVAQEWLDRFMAIEEQTELDLRLIAQARIVLDDLPGAIEAIEEAIAQQGPLEPVLREDLEKLQRAKRIRDSVKRPQ